MNKRILLSEHPYSECGDGNPLGAGNWPCSWISLPGNESAPQVAAYRLAFSVEKDEIVRIHVSADERYILYLDGQEIGRGSERGAPHWWFFESYDINLPAGEHLLAARTWFMGPGLRPEAQMSVRPGFILSAEGDWVERLGTGNAAWEGKRLSGYEFSKPTSAWGSGANLTIHADQYNWNHEQGAGDGWSNVDVHCPGFHPDFKEVAVEPAHIMQPATLPPMMHEERRTGIARFIEKIDSVNEIELAGKVLLSTNDIDAEKTTWNDLLQEGRTLEIPAHSRRRILIDLENYYCAYHTLKTSGGKGASIRVQWAESLYHELMADWDAPATFIYNRSKGNRDEILNKYFIGEGDLFLPDGEKNRTFEPLWWQAGRYIQFTIETDGQPLVLEDFLLHETRYPLESESSFSSDDKDFQAVFPIMERALQTGAHETYFDCPYYEQLMYTGDTRLETLVTYSITSDSRLPEKAIRMFDISRWHNGLTQGRYPSEKWVDLPPFSLYWTNMVHDHALWRNNKPLIKTYLPGIRAVLDGWVRYRDQSGAVLSPGNWNFVDWIAEWDKGGIPPGGQNGLCSILNWHLIYSLVRAAELEDFVGDPEIAQLQRRRATELAAAAVELFWNEEKGLFADDISQEHYSEHAQCFALLSGLVDRFRRKRIEKALDTETGLAQATIYFSHYYLETCRLLGRMDLFFKRIDKIWKKLPEMGMKTTYEMPGDSRSDNHGWGSHPIYHSFASILGIRPSRMGYRKVHIKPQLGSLNEASGKAIHPNGFIEAAFRRNGEKLTGEISLPEGLSGTLEINGQTVKLPHGVKNLKV